MDFIIAAQDVQLLQDELDVSKEAAEALLRQHRGVVADSLRSYIRGATA